MDWLRLAAATFLALLACAAFAAVCAFVWFVGVPAAFILFAFGFLVRLIYEEI